MASAYDTEEGIDALYQIAYQEHKSVASAHDTEEEEGLDALYQIAYHEQKRVASA